MKTRTFTFSVPASIGTEFEGVCVSERTTVVDKLAGLVFRTVEARTGIAVQQKVRLNGFTKRLFDSILDTEQFTVSQKAEQLKAVSITVRYGLAQLLNAGLVAPAGAVSSGSRYAESYRLTALGKSQRLIAEEVTEESKAEQRARVHLLLVSEGLTSADALKAIEDEEMVCHMGDVVMDYSLAFWKQWLKERREAHTPDVVNGAL